MKKVIVIRGPLGVGKSTVSKVLAEKLGCQYISLDKIIDDNHLSVEEGISVENFLKANNILVDIIKKTDKDCIVDGCFYYREQIDDLKDKLSNVVFFSLISSVEKCIERDAQRVKIYGEDAAKFVHMVTTKIKVGHEIDNTSLSVDETANLIVNILNIS